MKHVSLDALREREQRLHDEDYTDDNFVPVDRFMESSHGRLAEDSEEAALREKRSRKVLCERPIPHYYPFP